MSKKKDKAAAAEATPAGVSLAAHPRARASIRRTRAWTALAAFGLVLFLSLSAGVPEQEAALRALVAGVVGNVAAWGCALAVWRALVLAELRVAEQPPPPGRAAAPRSVRPVNPFLKSRLRAPMTPDVEGVTWSRPGLTNQSSRRDDHGPSYPEQR